MLAQGPAVRRARRQKLAVPTFTVGANSRLAYLKVRTMFGWSSFRPSVVSTSSFAATFSAGVLLCSMTCQPGEFRSSARHTAVMRHVRLRWAAFRCRLEHQLGMIRVLKLVER